MKAKWLVFLLAATLLLAAAYACGDDDDDDNDDNDAADDDAADDDDTTADDDDNDAADDDDDLLPLYDPTECAPFIEAWYQTCNLAFSVGDQEQTESESLADCETSGSSFWQCALTCYGYNSDQCVELYECVQQTCLDS
jgi:hypothetical protein